MPPSNRGANNAGKANSARKNQRIAIQGNSVKSILNQGSAPDYYRSAFAKLVEARKPAPPPPPPPKEKDAENNGTNTGSEEDGSEEQQQVPNLEMPPKWLPKGRNVKGSPESVGAFAARNELVTVIKGNIPLLICAGHGGTMPIPIDLADYDGSSPWEPPAPETEAAASTFFVPPRTKKHLPGFALVRDASTSLLAELVFLDVLCLLNPKWSIFADFLKFETLWETELKVPHVVIARFSRRFCDVNRPAPLASEHKAAAAAYDLYHSALAKAVESCGPEGLLLDLHGQGHDPRKILRGTLDGLTVAALLSKHGRNAFDESNDSLLGKMESLGLPILPSGLTFTRTKDATKRSIVDSRVEVRDYQHAHPGHPHSEPPPFEPETEGVPTTLVKEMPRYRGGWTVQRYGSHSASTDIGNLHAYDEQGQPLQLVSEKPSGIDAVQLEFGRSYRTSDAIWDTASKLAEALASFYGKFLDKETPKTEAGVESSDLEIVDDEIIRAKL